MAKKVLYAKLHDGFFIPGTGNMNDTLPPTNKTLTDLELTLEGSSSDYGPGSLLMKWTEKGVKKIYVIGAATVKGALVEVVEKTSNK